MPAPKTNPSLPLAVVQALSDGLLSVINKLNPRYARRVDEWLKSAGEEFEYRRARDGADAATEWLIGEWRAARLPDLRAGKNLKKDIRVVNQHYQLRLALEPVFRNVRSISNRNLQAAPIIAEVLGRGVGAETLPRDRRLAQFLHSLTGTNSVSLSQARRRVSRHAGSLLSKADARLELLAKVDPAYRVLAEHLRERLRTEGLPLVKRYKP